LPTMEECFVVTAVSAGTLTPHENANKGAKIRMRHAT
jgi:hypothetical protein